MKALIYFASIIFLASAATTDNNMAFLQEMDKLGLINLPGHTHIVTMTQTATRHGEMGSIFPSGDFKFTLNKDGANCDIVFSQDIHTKTWFLAPTFFIPEHTVVSDGCGIATHTGKPSVEGHVILHAATL